MEDNLSGPCIVCQKQHSEVAVPGSDIHIWGAFNPAPGHQLVLTGKSSIFQ
jgi:hypothetical protein